MHSVNLKIGPDLMLGRESHHVGKKRGRNGRKESGYNGLILAFKRKKSKREGGGIFICGRGNSRRSRCNIQEFGEIEAPKSGHDLLLPNEIVTFFQFEVNRGGKDMWKRGGSRKNLGCGGS